MFRLLNPWVILGVLLALVGSFLYGMRVGHGLEEAQQAKQEALIARATEAAQAGAAKEISKIKIVNQTHKQVLEREIRNVPSGSCVLSPDGVRAINEILTGKPQPAGSSQLPGADPAP